jgi:hypothetical protein
MCRLVVDQFPARSFIRATTAAAALPVSPVKEENLDALILCLIVAGIAYGAFRHGKRVGSRLGFRAGRRRRGRWRRR